VSRETPSTSSCFLSAGVLLAVLLLLALVVLLPWQAKMAEYGERIDTLANQLARFEGMRGAGPRLEAEHTALQERLKKSVFFLDAGTPALAAAALQNRIKEVITAQGATLVSTQNVEEIVKEKPRRIALRVRMSGDDAALLKVVYELEGGTPLLFIDNLSVRARTKARGRGKNRTVETLLDVQFDLAGYLREGEG